MSTQTMNIATKVRDICPVPKQALYRLSEPLNGHKFVVVSAATVLGRPETYIFAADETGEVMDWTELDGSQRDTLNHAAALLNAGYTIA